MAALVIPKNYSDATIFFESDMDDFRDALTTFINVTKLNDDNLQNAGITGSTKLIDGTVTGVKLATSIVDDSTIELASNVLQVKALGIDTAQLNTDAVTTVKITDLNVTTAKIAANAVTKAKIEALGQQLSSSQTQNTTSTTYADITGLNVTITTTGRPVLLFLQGTIAAAGSSLNAQMSAATSNGLILKLVRDSTDICETRISLVDSDAPANTDVKVPPGSFMFLDTPTSGTFTYKMQFKAVTASEIAGVSAVILVAYEL